MIFKPLNTDFFHFFKDVFEIILYFSHFFDWEDEYTAILISNCWCVSSSMLWAYTMDLSKDITVTKVPTFCVLNYCFKTRFLNSFISVIFLFLFHFFLMDSSQELLIFNKVISINPQFNFSWVYKVNTFWRISLLIKELSRTEVDRL